MENHTMQCLLPHNWSIWGTSKQGLNHIMSFRKNGGISLGHQHVSVRLDCALLFKHLSDQSDQKGTHFKADLWTLAMPAERANSISNPHKLLGSSHVEKRNRLQVTTEAAEAMCIYTHISERQFSYFLVFTLLVCGRFCGLCFFGIVVAGFVAFVFLVSWSFCFWDL